MMAKKKKAPAEKKERRDPRIEQVYEEEVTFDCPIRGKVTQKVKIKRYKPFTEQTQRPFVVSIDELTNKLEEEDDGLSIYSDGEELGVAGVPEESE